MRLIKSKYTPRSSTQPTYVSFRSQPPLPSHRSHTSVPYEVYGSAHPPSYSQDTVYDPYLLVPIVRPHISHRFAAQEPLKEFSGSPETNRGRDSSYNTLGYTATAYGVSTSKPYIGRHSTDRGFEVDRSLGEEHDRVQSLNIQGEADERVDDDGDGDGDDDDQNYGEDAGDEEQPVPVAPASRSDRQSRHGKGKGLTDSFMSVMSKISGSRNKRPGMAHEILAPIQMRKKAWIYIYFPLFAYAVRPGTQACKPYIQQYPILSYKNEHKLLDIRLAGYDDS
ncbi:hypothetical protein M9H77_34319 [Catharanthus roseus]|uniref:Uncharacterized protein n=1 Tax=Catharanthus roseus TaxID=4058 RepID=A0ACB9ZMJ8_CATRO|nr:hypothetical protein M9H77_34319 [Catharanthus roseus]